MSTTDYAPTYVEAADAADKLGITDATLGQYLATAAIDRVRAHVTRMERHREIRYEDIVGEFDEHMEDARNLLVAAAAAFDAVRRSAS